MKIESVKKIGLSYRKAVFAAVSVTVIFISVFLVLYPVARINWMPGSFQTYEYKTKSVVDTFDLRTGARTRVNSYMEGKLHMRVFNVHDHSVQVGFFFEPGSIIISGLKTDKLIEMYKNVFLAEFSKNGTINKFYFNNTVSVEDEHYLSNMIESVLFELNGDSRRSWKTIESITEGNVRAEYTSRRHDEYGKKRTAFLEKRNADNPPRINKSEFEYILNRSGSWLKSVKGYEKRTMGEGSQMRVTTYFQIDMGLSQNRNDCSLFEDPRSFEEIAASLKEGFKNTVSAWDQIRNDVYAETLKGENFLSVLSKMKGKKISSLEAVKSFKALFAIRKGALDEAVRTVRSMSLSPLDSQIVMFSIAEFSSPESQKAIIGFLQDASLPMSLRKNAAVYCGLMSDVSVETMKQLESAVQTFKNEKNPELMSASILAIGSMGSRLKNSEETVGEINRYLKENLNKGSDNVTEMSAFLGAAANSGNPDLFASVASFSTSGKSSLRASAIDALHSFEGKEVDSILLSAVKNDSDLFVVSSALSVQMSRPHNADFTDAVLTRLEKEKNAEAKYEMIKYLSSQSVDDSGMKVLNKIKKDETNAQTIVLINEVLNRKKK
jgi:hypothetical protein